MSWVKHLIWIQKIEPQWESSPRQSPRLGILAWPSIRISAATSSSTHGWRYRVVTALSRRSSTTASSKARCPWPAWPTRLSSTFIRCSMRDFTLSIFSTSANEYTSTSTAARRASSASSCSWRTKPRHWATENKRRISSSRWRAPPTRWAR